jgi:PiT family inorganic phosphate transporter
VQLISAAALSFGHGANDAQKTIGVLGALLAGAGVMGVSLEDGELTVPIWVSLACYLAIAAGTWSGGWRIIETMGLRITRLFPASGASANIGSCTAVFAATGLGVPISTTQAVVFSIVGAGVASGEGARWRTLGGIVLGWIVTMPATALLSFVLVKITLIDGPLPWIAIGVGMLAGLVWVIQAMRSGPGANDVAAEVSRESAES